MNKEGIKNKDQLSNWLKVNSVSEQEMSRQLYVNLRLENLKRRSLEINRRCIFEKKKS